MQTHSIYLHIPFCRHRCAYCDFNTYAGQEARIPAYVAALQREIEAFSACAGEQLPVHTVYFGGGTPSLLPISAFEQVLAALDRNFSLTSQAEISIEANPGTLSAGYLRGLRASGVNRLSLGMQSANPLELTFLERQHQFQDVIHSVEWARQAGFDNLSLDLIFGLPEQQIGTWEASLHRGLTLAPEHFSLYALTIEHGTPLQRQVDLGMIPAPDPDQAAEMYELACERLNSAGYVQYEISNWAKTRKEPGSQAPDSPLSATSSPHFACQHNLQYWRNQPYIGFGAGAHGYVGGYRTRNVLAPAAYIRRLEQVLPPNLHFPRTAATVNAQKIDSETEMGETMMMGLRLTREGVSDASFAARFNVNLRQVYAEQIKKFVSWGLLEWAGDHLRLTRRGYLLGNQIFSEFL